MGGMRFLYSSLRQLAVATACGPLMRAITSTAGAAEAGPSPPPDRPVSSVALEGWWPHAQADPGLEAAGHDDIDPDQFRASSPSIRSS